MHEISAGGGHAFVVDLPGGLQNHQPRGVDLGSAFGDPLLHGLLRSQGLARRQLARGRPLTHQIEGSLADADPTHAMVDASRSQTLLGDGKTGAFLPQQIAPRHAAVLVGHLGMAVVVVAGVAHD
jgi:hypothetical protein